MTVTAPVVAPSKPNLHPCPTCREPIVGGLLAMCSKPACIEADIAETARIERRYGW